MAMDSMTDATMPLTEHLRELRTRLIRALLAVGVGFAVCYGYADVLFALLARPLVGLESDGVAVNLIGTGVAEAFFTKIKVAAIGGVFLASPVILYQIWAFVVPGLYDSEKRYARPFVFFGTFFFFAGALFCYELVMPLGYRFFLEQYVSIGVAPEIRISEYLSFTSRMLLAFGTTFEMPVVTFFLARIGLVTHRTLIDYGRYAVVGIFVAAALLTPSVDVASQFLMAGPLLVLYVVSIGVAFVFARPAPGAAEAGDTPG
jgi:sec-independent protein translocase protein TatC